MKLHLVLVLPAASCCDYLLVVVYIGRMLDVEVVRNFSSRLKLMQDLIWSDGLTRTCSSLVMPSGEFLRGRKPVDQ
jgi:hypothetical protein